MKMREERPCIYCQQTDHPKDEEHVLQRTFGAELTLKDEVCKGCNNFFSAYDGDLRRFVRTLDELRHHHAVRSHDLMLFNGHVSLAFDEPSGLWFAYSHRTGRGDTWKRVPFPQLMLRPDGTIAYGNDGEKSAQQWEEDRKSLETDLASVEGLKISFEDWRTPDNAVPPHPIIVQSARRTYAIVASSLEQRKEVMLQIENGRLSALVAGLKAAPAARSVEGLKFSFRGRFLDPLVPVVKIGINFACHVLGYEAIQRSEFDWIRRYARYHEMPDRAFACIFDQQRRAKFLNERPMMRKLCSFPGHKLLLHARPGMPLQVLIVLYEHIFASVDLLRAEQTSWLPEEGWLAIFDYRDKTYEVLTASRDTERYFTLTGARQAYAKSLRQRRRRRVVPNETDD